MTAPCHYLDLFYATSPAVSRPPTNYLYLVLENLSAPVKERCVSVLSLCSGLQRNRLSRASGGAAEFPSEFQ